MIADERPARLLDLGTGGGLPGSPIACADDAVHVTLLDARRKKIEAVQRICDALALDNVVAKWGRAEELGRGPGAVGLQGVDVLPGIPVEEHQIVPQFLDPNVVAVVPEQPSRE